MQNWQLINPHTYLFLVPELNKKLKIKQDCYYATYAGDVTALSMYNETLYI